MFIEEYYRKALIHFLTMLKEDERSFTDSEEQMQEVPTKEILKEIRKLKEKTPLSRYYFCVGFTYCTFATYLFTDEEVGSGEATEGIIDLSQFRKEFLED